MSWSGALTRRRRHTIQRSVADPGRGILVIRHDHETFTIELTDRVDDGLIHKVDARN